MKLHTLHTTGTREQPNMNTQRTKMKTAASCSKAPSPSHKTELSLIPTHQSTYDPLNKYTLHNLYGSGHGVPELFCQPLPHDYFVHNWISISLGKVRI